METFFEKKNGEIILELCIYLLGMEKNLPSDLHALTLMIQNQTLLALKHINWNNPKREKGFLSSMEENFRKHSMTYVDRQSFYLFFLKKKSVDLWKSYREFTIFLQRAMTPI